MRHPSSYEIILFTFLVIGVYPTTSSAATGRTGGYRYLSPVPGSELVSPANNVILCPGRAVDPSSLPSARISVVGSQSGEHTGELVLSDDLETLVFIPDELYSPGEIVQVDMRPGVEDSNGKQLPPVRFSFHISPSGTVFSSAVAAAGLRPEFEQMFPSAPRIHDVGKTTQAPEDSCPCLPASYPEVSLLTANNPDPGNVFVTPFSFAERASHLVMVDNTGMPVFYRHYPGGPALDFKRQPNGLLSAFISSKGGFVIYDAEYNEVGIFRAGNGYRTDFHGLQLLNNGHALLQIYDPQPVRMDEIVPGGRPDASVTGFIVQELDKKGRVVFQWRSWDHMEITDMAAQHISLTDSTIDYVHGNAVELDHDGNLLISSRHLNEITKIDRKTGEIIWRMGLHAKRNEFTFINDPRGFSYQHDIRRLPNGNITIYDNGVLLDPEYSRALEYKLDEANKTATLVWQYRHVPDVFAGFMGNVQRREGGGSTIGWGGNLGDPKMTDIHADGSVAYELSFSPGYTSYRAFRFPWQGTRFVLDEKVLTFGAVQVGESASLPLTIRNTSGSDVRITCFASVELSFTVMSDLPLVIPAGSSHTVEVLFAPLEQGPVSARLHVRQVSEDELVAESVLLRGIGGERGDGLPWLTPDDLAESGGNSGVFRLYPTQPNPTKGAARIQFDLARSGHVSLEVFDVRGRKVATLVNEVRSAGRYHETWQAGRARSGLYFCQLRLDDRTKRGKVLLLR